MTIELKDCPMCGCKATFVKHSAGMPGTQGFDKWDAVACMHCRTTVGACDRRFRCREDAAEAWNRRVPQASLLAKEAECEALRKDAARLDWLDKNPGRVKHSIGYRGAADSWVWTDASGYGHDAPNLRAAIDAALVAAKGTS